MKISLNVIKNRNRKRNRRTVNNKRINDVELYYYLNDLAQPQSLSK